ncbi:hypothetical protein SPF06_20510 [Sinomonas sp. JGH33]|uniref:Hydrogenase-4 component E n=1 Tax=Sinomonas terricola TaxID=3110330 RepID=A0ABU5TC97_9MICC|nr:hypothetical protein [Sinomonas sp. JGH33]MEA5457109.1 hypothetical protein [Sinomonas sp. JGH33]
MSDALYVQLLDLAGGALLLTAVVILWRRRLTAIVRVFAVQGLALSLLVGVLAAHENDPTLGGIAVGLLVLRAGVLPWLLRRALAAAGNEQHEARPLVNVAASLLAAAVLVLIAYAVSQPLVELFPSAASTAIPVGMAVVLIGFFALVTRRHALSQLVGFLLMDNGITAVGFLATTGVALVVELGISLDVLMAVLVLYVLANRMREAFGTADLDDLRELHD